MQYAVVSVFDKAVSAFGLPLFVPAAGVAMRSFEDEVNRCPDGGKVNDYFTHPEHFELWQVARFDSETAMFDQTVAPFVLCRAVDVKGK